MQDPLQFDLSLMERYKSPSQKVRAMSEDWVQKTVFCPRCGRFLSSYENNHPVGDFFCKNCLQDFELKSKKNRFGNKISAGEYNTMIRRLKSNQNPDFFFLAYKEGFFVNDFIFIPKYFFTPDLVEKRPPLKETAKRAGWIGCNLLINKVPKSGQVFYIKNGERIKKEEILRQVQKTLFLKEKKLSLRGWTLDVMKCIDLIDSKEFSLDQIYAFEKNLAQKYPDNHFIKDKIRQQLQYLRDKGYLKFISKGKYKVE
ncbi:MAG: DpnI domain-containing protein [Alphaproteobacteria bacterium]|nr:DpnI domain-containing protein [Alphaproteobacteria bacterium]